MKKIGILLIAILVVSVGFLSGCTSKGANVKITSVDIDQSEDATYDVTVNLKNVGDEGIKTRIDLKFQYWNEDMSTWQTGFTYNIDRDTVYIDVGDTTNVAMSVSGYGSSDMSCRIYVEIYQYEDDSYWNKTESYEKLL